MEYKLISVKITTKSPGADRAREISTWVTAGGAFCQIDDNEPMRLCDPGDFEVRVEAEVEGEPGQGWDRLVMDRFGDGK